MEGIQFQEEQRTAGRAPASAGPALLIRIAYASGFAKTEEEASRVLLVAAIVIALLAIAVAILFLRSGGGSKPAPLPADPRTVPSNATLIAH